MLFDRVRVTHRCEEIRAPPTLRNIRILPWNRRRYMGKIRVRLGLYFSLATRMKHRFLAILCLLLFAPGCVERRLTIRTNPPGALCYVDDHEVGITPVSTSFIYYGNRKIRLVKDGFETLTVIEPVGPPWYEIPPIDFFSETLVIGKLRDSHSLLYQLRPQIVVPQDQLLGRAEQLRQGTQSQAQAGAAIYRYNPPNVGPGSYVPPSGGGLPAGQPAYGAQPIYQLPPQGPTGQ